MHLFKDLTKLWLLSLYSRLLDEWILRLEGMLNHLHHLHEVLLDDQKAQGSEDGKEDQAASEKKTIDVMEVKEARFVEKPPPTQKMLKRLQSVENWYLTREWMLQNDGRFQVLPWDWKRF